MSLRMPGLHLTTSDGIKDLRTFTAATKKAVAKRWRTRKRMALEVFAIHESQLPASSVTHGIIENNPAMTIGLQPMPLSSPPRDAQQSQSQAQLPSCVHSGFNSLPAHNRTAVYFRRSHPDSRGPISDCDKDDWCV